MSVDQIELIRHEPGLWLRGDLRLTDTRFPLRRAGPFRPVPEHSGSAVPDLFPLCATFYLQILWQAMTGIASHVCNEGRRTLDRLGLLAYSGCWQAQHAVMAGNALCV